MEPGAFKEINPDAFGGFKPKKFNGLPDELIGQIDDDQFGKLKPNLIKKMDETLITSLAPKALEGMTEKQAKKMKTVLAEALQPDQISSIEAATLLAMPDNIFDILSSGFSTEQIEAISDLPAVLNVPILWYLTSYGLDVWLVESQRVNLKELQGAPFFGLKAACKSL